MSDVQDGLSAAGSQLSGEKERDSLPTPDHPQPPARTHNWPLLYGAVLTELAILILVFYAFTKAFS